MGFLRSTLQVRSVPERLIEWILIYVPIDTVAGGIQRFGFDAKRYALWSAIFVTLAVLAGLGMLALRGWWSNRANLALGVGLWLFTMVVVMPLTDAGLFAVALADGARAVVLGYLAVALTYAAALVAAREVILDANAPLDSLRLRPAGGSNAFWSTLLS